MLPLFAVEFLLFLGVLSVGTTAYAVLLIRRYREFVERVYREGA